MSMIGKLGVEVLRRVHLMDDKVDRELVLVIAGVAIGVIGEVLSEKEGLDNSEQQPQKSSPEFPSLDEVMKQCGKYDPGESPVEYSFEYSAIERVYNFMKEKTL